MLKEYQACFDGSISLNVNVMVIDLNQNLCLSWKLKFSTNTLKGCLSIFFFRLQYTFS